MAKRHVIQYFLEQENEYMEMLSNVKELEECVKENKISQEEYLQAVNEITKIKRNYESIAYFIFLLNKPNKKEKDEDKIIREWYNILQEKSKEALLDGSKDALIKIKETLEKIRKGETNE